MKILLAEDARFARQLLQGALAGWGYEVVLAEDGEQAWRALQGADAPSIALLDWMMPGLDGLQVCRKVREAGREPYTYIILLTGRDRQEDVVEGLAAGADDYLRKPFDNLELEARIRTGRRIVELHGQLIAAREALREQATTDPLTGLANRRTILETLGKEWQRCRRSAAACAVLFVDLDHFKQVNDTHGHSAGDEVLRQSASTMRTILRPYDLVGRYGGEEFVVVLPECDAAGARAAAERLRESVAGSAIAVGGASVRVTCSLGIAVGDSRNGWDRDVLPPMPPCTAPSAPAVTASPWSVKTRAPLRVWSKRSRRDPRRRSGGEALAPAQDDERTSPAEILRDAIAAHPRRPAILMSGHDANHDAILEALGMGPVMFVHKPMSSADLDSALQMFRELVPGMVRRVAALPEASRRAKPGIAFAYAPLEVLSHEGNRIRLCRADSGRRRLRAADAGLYPRRLRPERPNIHERGSRAGGSLRPNDHRPHRWPRCRILGGR